MYVRSLSQDEVKEYIKISNKIVKGCDYLISPASIQRKMNETLEKILKELKLLRKDLKK